MDDLRQRFGRLVAANRKRKGLTQQQLAEQSGISHDMINRIERGVAAARFPNISKLAAALDIDPAELFTPNLPASSPRTAALTNLVARLSALPDRDILWIDQLLDAALKPRVSTGASYDGQVADAGSVGTDRPKKRL